MFFSFTFHTQSGAIYSQTQRILYFNFHNNQKTIYGIYWENFQPFLNPTAKSGLIISHIYELLFILYGPLRVYLISLFTIKLNFHGPFGGDWGQTIVKQCLTISIDQQHCPVQEFHRKTF